MGIRKTTFQITVLRPDIGEEVRRTTLSLDDLDLELGVEGSWLGGSFKMVEDHPIPDADVKAAEYEFGGDGDFFVSLGYVKGPETEGE